MATPPVPCVDFDSDRLTLRLRLAFAADVRSIDGIVDSVVAVVRTMECASGHEDDIELCLREALANAVIHGARSDPSKQVECCVACDSERGMLLVVRDPGAGFDPAALPSPLHGEPLFWNHGRGIFLINQLMDHVEHAAGGTEIRMRKFLKPQKPDCAL